MTQELAEWDPHHEGQPGRGSWPLPGRHGRASVTTATKKASTNPQGPASLFGTQTSDAPDCNRSLAELTANVPWIGGLGVAGTEPARPIRARSGSTYPTGPGRHSARRGRLAEARAAVSRSGAIRVKARARIEQAVGKLKRFKRIALRCEKKAQNYGSFVALALGFILIKSVHTA
jgi:hypothetical protein